MDGAGAGAAQRATGSRLIDPRRLIAPNGTPVYLNRCRYARARESGGNNRDDLFDPRESGGVVLR